MFKIIKEILSYVIIIVVVILIRTFIGTPVRVNGTSMVPTLKEGEVLYLNKLDKSYFTYFDDKVYINSKGMYKINEILTKNSW